jgi:hypothetical protein
MTNQNPHNPRQTIVKILLLVWIGLVLLVFLVLYGPPEIQSIVRRMGFEDGFNRLYEWLKTFFVADYLS